MGQLGLCEAECLLVSVLISHLGGRVNLFLLLNISYWRPIHQHTHTSFVLWLFIQNKAEFSAKFPSVGRMLRPYCSECPPGISPHYCALLCYEKQTVRRCICAVMSSLFSLFSIFLLVKTDFHLAAEVCGLKFAVIKSM